MIIFKRGARTVVFSVVLLCISGNASADWTKVSNSGAGADDFTGYVDTATIERSGDVAKMADLRDYRQPQLLKASGKSYLSKRVSVEYQCKEEKMRWLELVHFAAAMGKGEVVHRDDQPRSWISVNRGTVAETRWKIACGQKKLRTVVAEADAAGAVIAPARTVR
jgi:hypothetical protein